jgi:CDP-diacylglycerol--glycerol-3-phosphate 3-phosphatidyltransferase
MNRAEYLKKWSIVHGYESGSEVSGIARNYLSLNYYFVKPFVLLRFSPHVVTFLGPLFAVGALFIESNAIQALLILLSLVVDGFDGAVALIRNKASDIGAVWDGIVDRVTELLWIGALYYAGISPALLLTIWIAVATQEYGRAKLNHVLDAKSGVLGVVTICERPVRGLLVSFGFLGQIFLTETLFVISIIWLAMQSVALTQFILAARKRLHQRQSRR